MVAAKQMGRNSKIVKYRKVPDIFEYNLNNYI